MKIYKPSDSQNNHEPFEELDAEINIVPLVDVVLVLLIIFMVAAPLSISSIKVNLPETSQKNTLIEEPELILSINAGGQYYIGKEKIKKTNLVGKLSAIYQARKSKVLFIHADKSLIYDEIITAMNDAQEAGIKKISLLTKPL